MDHLASAAPCSAHHSFTAQSAHPGQQRAPRTARSSRVRLDGMGAKRLSWLVAWCWPGIIIHNHISWRLSIGRARPGGHMRGGGWHTQTIIAAAATKFQTSWLMIKCWKQCSQCSSLHSDRVLSMGNIFRVIMMLYALNFKIVGDHNNYTVVEVVKYLKGESPYL